MGVSRKDSFWWRGQQIHRAYSSSVREIAAGGEGRVEADNEQITSPVGRKQSTHLQQGMEHSSPPCMAGAVMLSSNEKGLTHCASESQL